MIYRIYYMVESTYHQLPVSGFVYGCGAHIEKDGQLLFSVQFPKEEMDALMTFDTPGVELEY